MSTMTSKKKIATDLQSALSGQSPLSIDLYVEVLADYEDELKASLDKDAAMPISKISDGPCPEIQGAISVGLSVCTKFCTPSGPLDLLRCRRRKYAR